MNTAWRVGLYGIVSVVAPPNEIVMTPPQAQVHIDALFRAGMLPTMTVGEPGVHGAGITGVHGIGVSTPSAAAVAAATVGLAKLMHMPNGAMLTIGLLSMIVATGLFSNITLAVGSTVSVDGAAPNGQVNIAFMTTGSPM